MIEHQLPERYRTAARLRQDAESAARVGDISVRRHNWLMAGISYRLARDLNTAARQVELNLYISPSYRTLVQEAREKED